MNSNKYLIVPTVLVAASLLSGALLVSNKVSADSDTVVDNVSVSVPVSCSIEGTGMNSHTASITNGTYQAGIGTTTLKAFCNDSEGFAIYANGYTGDTLGNNKLIGNSTAGEIVTGTATTAGSPDISNWAMKLATPTSPAPTYPITIDNGFGSYSNVPSSYTKVAHRDSGTDLGTSAEGATLTTTYAAYISKTQLSFVIFVFDFDLRIEYSFLSIIVDNVEKTIDKHLLLCADVKRCDIILEAT